MSALALRDDMRRLWQDHVAWTRIAVISAVAGLPDTAAAVERLQRNQTELGDAIKPFYGEAAGDGLAALLHEHIGIAVELVSAAKQGDANALAAAQGRWTANAEQIASFLAQANSRWPVDELKSMMSMHLEQTLVEAKARLAGDWQGDVVAYDAINAHILQLADALAQGIAAQFPERVVRDPALSAKREELHVALRSLWQDHVIWTRTFIISALAGLGDADTAAARLLQNQVAIGDAVKPFYGDAAGAALTALLRDHITIAAELLTAAKAGDGDALADASARWNDNADQIAVFLAQANPNWPVADLKSMMHVHLEQTLAAAKARLAGDWAADVRAYDAIVPHVLAMADALSDGIAKQHPELVR